MKMVLFEFEPQKRAAFKGREAEHEITYRRETLTADNAADHGDAEILATFIYSRVDPAVLEAMPRLRFITTRSTGFDHIDVEACRERGIPISCVPTYGDHTVAEHAMGVIGTGAIGLHTCRLAWGHGMEVLATDLKPNEEAAREIGFTYRSMEDLLAEADVISIHVPASPKTAGMIGTEQFARMKDGAVLLNMARDEAETLRAVYNEEHDLRGLLADHALLRLNNHTGFASLGRG